MNVKSHSSSKKKIAFTLFITVITIINIIACALIFSDIQLMKSPETTIKIDLIEINAEEAIIETTLQIKNPNPFTLIIKNLGVVTTTPNGNEIAKMQIRGGEIAPNKNKTFTSSEHIRFDGQSPELLTSKITGTVGVHFLGIIKKTLPIAINVITSVENIIEDISAPIFHVTANFGEITQEGLNFTGEIDVTNPNSFDMAIENFSVNITTEKGENVGYIDIEEGTIEAKSTRTLDSGGRILFKALDAEILTVNIGGEAVVKIAGITKSIAIATEVELKIPRFEDLFSVDKPTDATIRSDTKATLRGFVSDLTLEIINPNTIALAARDITFSIYRVDNDEKSLLGKCVVKEKLLEPGNTTTISGQITMPYSKLLFSRGAGFIPDWLLLTVRVNVTLPGLEQSIWVGVGGYQDLHIFL